jgi:HD-GYP domain-containing protein (c-di-GMP phosphodiesterase class II)
MSSRDGLFELAADGRLLDVNPTFREWLGQPREAVIGRPLAKFAICPTLEVWLGTADWTGFLRLQGRRGERLVSITITEVRSRDYGPVRAIGVARDLPQSMPVDEQLQQKVDELDTTQLVTINTLAKLAEFHDPDIAGHLERVRLYTFSLAGWLAEQGKGEAALTETQVIELARCAVLHDVGKVAVPERVLQKPGRLNPEEWELMKTHATFGGEFLAGADGELQKLLGVSSTFLSTAADIAMYHHERFNGDGYPRGFKGFDIPLPARIVALADVYDALTSVRVYKQAWTHAEAKELITKEQGRHFDPQVVAAFLATEEIFGSIYESMQSAVDLPLVEQAR